METAGNTYSSAHLRERDKILEEKHRKQFALVERKVDRLRRSNDDTLKQLFDVRTRGDKLARSLGFNDIHEAQVAVDTTEHESPLTFKECFVRVDALQSELTRERTQHEKLREYLRLVEQERDYHKASAATADQDRGDLKNTICKQREISDGLSQDLAQLKARYDSLSEVKERALERYKRDYHKWRKFKNWIFTDEEYAKGKDGQELSVVEKKRRRNKGILKKKKLVMELGPDYTERHPEGDANMSPSGLYPPPMGGTSPPREDWDFENDKDNEATPIPERKPQRPVEPPRSSQSMPLPSTIVASTTISPSSSLNAATRVVSTPLLRSLANVIPSLSPPTSLPQTLTNSSRIPLTFQPIFTSTSRGSSQVKIKQEPGSSPPVPVPAAAPRPMKRLRPVHAPSSDTEDDSQAIDLFPAATPIFKVPAPPTTALKSLGPATSKPSAVMDDSQTEDESQMFPLPFMPTTKEPARPHTLYTFSQHEKQKDRRRSDPIATSLSRNVGGDTMPPPRKMRRLSGNDVRSNAPAAPTSSAATVQGCERDDRDIQKQKAPTLISSKKVLEDKKQEKENINSVTSTDSSGSQSGQKRLQDYSTFKGRGRYAKDLESSDKTINAEYVIDPAQNGGLEFRYDEVVRTKEDRRRMDAGDCECCRDYYTAIGPLPARLQAPLWRSPPTSPVKSKASCPRHGGEGDSSSATHLAEEPQMDSERQAAITSHKQAISRHRHHWERPRTPPGYWNIGFPDTQEAADINERAREMHRRKREEVESEVRKGGGKYKRRQGV